MATPNPVSTLAQKKAELLVTALTQYISTQNYLFAIAHDGVQVLPNTLANFQAADQLNRKNLLAIIESIVDTQHM